MTYAKARSRTNSDINRLDPCDAAIHEWYRFVLSYPPHLVRDYLDRFEVVPGDIVLDPFCGTGTTLVEARKRGIQNEGIEANPMAHFASSVKLDWSPEPDGLITHAQQVAEAALGDLQSQCIEDVSIFETDVPREGLRTLPPEAEKLLLRNSISPLPLHKTLVLLDEIRKLRDERYYRHELLALARVAVYSISNLKFGPEVGVGAAKTDTAVVAPWLAAVRSMADDVRLYEGNDTPSSAHHADARHIPRVFTRGSISAVITSPPYPNEKDYTRTTRLESVLLGFIKDRADLRALKQGLVRSNTRGVYRGDDDDSWVAKYPEIERIASEIEARRIELGKTSGFERMYPRVTKLYFGGMARHFAELRAILKPGARLAYVVGDQASYLRVMIRTGQLLAGIAESLGYEVEGLDLFRTRLATATRAQMREEVLVLRWPGD